MRIVTSQIRPARAPHIDCSYTLIHLKANLESLRLYRPTNYHNAIYPEVVANVQPWPMWGSAHHTLPPAHAVRYNLECSVSTTALLRSARVSGKVR